MSPERIQNQLGLSAFVVSALRYFFTSLNDVFDIFKDRFFLMLLRHQQVKGTTWNHTHQSSSMFVPFCFDMFWSRLDHYGIFRIRLIPFGYTSYHLVLPVDTCCILDHLGAAVPPAGQVGVACHVISLKNLSLPVALCPVWLFMLMPPETGATVRSAKFWKCAHSC